MSPCFQQWGQPWPFSSQVAKRLPWYCYHVPFQEPSVCSFLSSSQILNGGYMQSDPPPPPAYAWESWFQILLLWTSCLLSRGGPSHLTSLHVTSRWFFEVVFLSSMSENPAFWNSFNPVFISTNNPFPSCSSKTPSVFSDGILQIFWDGLEGWDGRQTPRFCNQDHIFWSLLYSKLSFYGNGQKPMCDHWCSFNSHSPYIF